MFNQPPFIWWLIDKKIKLNTDNMQQKTKETEGPIKGKGPDGEPKVRPYDKVHVKWIQQPVGQRKNRVGELEQVHPYLAKTLAEKGYVEIIEDEDDAKAAIEASRAQKKAPKSSADAANATITKGKGGKKSESDTEI